MITYQDDGYNIRIKDDDGGMEMKNRGTGNTNGSIPKGYLSLNQLLELRSIRTAMPSIQHL